MEPDRSGKTRQLLLPLLMFLVGLGAMLMVGGCVFNDSAIASKTGCKVDGDCLGGRICACAECVRPDFVPASCGLVGRNNSPADAGMNPDGGDGGGGGGGGDAVDGDVVENSGNNGAPNSTPCGDNAANACGGCSSLAGIPETPCGDCMKGAWVCRGFDTVECVGDGANACGGCADLDREPGAQCGECPMGRVVCDGEESTRCEGGDRNACDGCSTLPGLPEEECGTCGTGVYACLGFQLICEGPGLNVCGGCQDLAEELGGACGTCGEGVWACAEDGESLVCTEPDGRNGCGGCATLPFEAGEACGECGDGVGMCLGDDEVTCEGGGRNACGGCALLSAAPESMCGCGTETFVCDSPDQVACVDNFATFEAPVDLGDMGPDDDRRSVQGLLHDGADEDWYVVETQEDFIQPIEPDVDLEAPADYDLCVYYKWDNHSDLVADCDSGVPSTFGTLRGCCATTTNNNESIDLGGIEGIARNDEGVMWIRVYTERDVSSCESYSLRYRL